MNNNVGCLVLLLVASLVLVVDSATLLYPLKVTYLEQADCCHPNVTILDAVDAGFNVIVLAFYQSATGPADGATSWASLDDATKKATMAQVHAKGAKVIVSLGGANDQSWETMDAKTLGTTIANWANAHFLDGVDFDLEHFGGFNAAGGNPPTEATTVTFFSTLISTVRGILGNEAVLSLAPLAPWFGPIGMETCSTNGQANCSWVGPSGGMTGVYKEAGNAIDFFFVQFYNQGTCYTSEDGIFTQSGPNCVSGGDYYPYTSIAEIAAGGIPLTKIVLGKPSNSGSAANSGYIDPSTLRTWMNAYTSKTGWNTGAGIWVWNTPGTDAITWMNGAFPPGDPNSATQAHSNYGASTATGSNSGSGGSPSGGGSPGSGGSPSGSGSMNDASQNAHKHRVAVAVGVTFGLVVPVLVITGLLVFFFVIRKRPWPTWATPSAVRDKFGAMRRSIPSFV